MIRSSIHLSQPHTMVHNMVVQSPRLCSTTRSRKKKDQQPSSLRGDGRAVELMRCGEELPASAQEGSVGRRCFSESQEAAARGGPAR
jgi:hypothetical protein